MVGGMTTSTSTNTATTIVISRRMRGITNMVIMTVTIRSSGLAVMFKNVHVM